MEYYALYVGKMCKTCNLEKIEIALADIKQSLNKRQKLFLHVSDFRKLYFKTKHIYSCYFCFCFSIFAIFFVKCLFLFVVL